MGVVGGWVGGFVRRLLLLNVSRRCMCTSHIPYSSTHPPTHPPLPLPHSFKNSGLANSKALDVSVVEGGKHGPKIVFSSKVRQCLPPTHPPIHPPTHPVEQRCLPPPISPQPPTRFPCPAPHSNRLVLLFPTHPPTHLYKQAKKSLSKPATLAHKTPLNKAFRTSVKSITGLTKKSGKSIHSPTL